MTRDEVNEWAKVNGFTSYNDVDDMFHVPGEHWREWYRSVGDARYSIRRYEYEIGHASFETYGFGVSGRKGLANMKPIFENEPVSKLDGVYATLKKAWAAINSDSQSQGDHS